MAKVNAYTWLVIVWYGQQFEIATFVLTSINVTPESMEHDNINTEVVKQVKDNDETTALHHIRNAIEKSVKLGWKPCLEMNSVKSKFYPSNVIQIVFYFLFLGVKLLALD